MRITIHRGIDQIGGCITEISTGTSRVFVDMGDNLPGETNASDDEKSAMVQRIFSQGKKENEAVIYSHGHGDHIGLMCFVPTNVPQYLSEGTKKQLLDRYENLAKINAPEGEKWLHVINKSIVMPAEIKVGNITIRSFNVSHSAYDSRMFLIEADGERILHTGDFRGHGYFSKDLLVDLEKFASPIDYLVIEGTMLHRGNAEPERKIADKIQAVIERHKNVLVLTSAMSWERIMSVCHANLRSNLGKPLITCSSHWKETMDNYAADNPRYSQVYKNYHYTFNGKNTKLEKWIDDKGMVVLSGSGHVDLIRKIIGKYGTEDFALVFSVWRGYLLPEQKALHPAYSEIHDMFQPQNIYYIHTSGHADVKTLVDVIKRMNPRKAIIGIHKEADASLCELEIPQALKDKVIPDNLSLDNVVTI